MSEQLRFFDTPEVFAPVILPLENSDAYQQTRQQAKWQTQMYLDNLRQKTRKKTVKV